MSNQIVDCCPTREQMFESLFEGKEIIFKLDEGEERLIVSRLERAEGLAGCWFFSAKRKYEKKLACSGYVSFSEGRGAVQML